MPVAPPAVPSGPPARHRSARTQRHHGGRLGALAALAALGLAACGTGSTGAAAPSSSAGATTSASPAGPASGSASGTASGTATGTASGTLPRPAHTVVVVMENHDFGAVVGSSDAPWLGSLPAAVLTDWHGVAHPSQPNYVALLTGSTHGVTDDHCPVTVPGPSLAGQLAGAGLSFTGWSEGLPAAGSTVCSAGDYRRKHNPWVDVAGLPASVNQPFSAFPRDFAALPTVSIVAPDLCHDTHDCPVATGDAWLRANLGPYLAWAQTHDSLLVVTYDESEHHAGNHIPTLLAGPMVRPGRYADRGDHYRLLRTLEALYGLPGIGDAASAAPLTSVWR